MTERSDAGASTSEKSPWFPWFPRDHAADEPVVLMSLEEEGAYRRLLDHQWLHGSIPTDLGEIGRICKNTAPRKMATLWKALAPCFKPAPGAPDRLQNGRLERIRQERDEFRVKAAEAGRRGAEARWGNRGKPNGHPNDAPNGDPIATAVPDGMAKNGSAPPPAPPPAPAPPHSPAAAAAPPDVSYLVRCVVALNRGLAENPALGPRGFNQVAASQQAGRVTWEQEGIPIELVERVVQERARGYPPTDRNRQPSGLRYFDNAVREAHELARQQSTAPARPTAPAKRIREIV